jgi:histidinol-phosphate phosphatase family protein
VRLLNDLGLGVAIVSNQPGIAKGHLKAETLKAFERAMLKRIQAVGGRIDRIYYCLHHPEAKVRKLRQRCDCRKPQIGMLKNAAADLQVALDQCYMIGDGIPDLMAGSRAGCRTIFVGRWKCEICQFTEAPHARPAFVVKDLWEAANRIRAELTGSGRPISATTCIPASA